MVAGIVVGAIAVLAVLAFGIAKGVQRAKERAKEDEPLDFIPDPIPKPKDPHQTSYATQARNVDCMLCGKTIEIRDAKPRGASADKKTQRYVCARDCRTAKCLGCRKRVRIAEMHRLKRYSKPFSPNDYVCREGSCLKCKVCDRRLGPGGTMPLPWKNGSVAIACKGCYAAKNA